jgi:hypothetical protein
MNLKHVAAARSLVQRIDVLGDQRPQVTGCFQLSQDAMTGVRLGCLALPQERLEPLVEDIRVLGKSPDRSDGEGIVARPQTIVWAAKVRNSGRRADACAGKPYGVCRPAKQVSDLRNG